MTTDLIYDYIASFILAAPWLIGIVALGLHIMLCVFVGIGAHRRRRDGAGWGVFALFATPLVAGFSLLLLGRKPVRVASQPQPEHPPEDTKPDPTPEA
ncbi:MAG: hypothetical protein ACOC2N_01675 [Spirochaetota bacterium]